MRRVKIKEGKMQEKFKKEELLFCYYFAELSDVKESAEKAGITDEDAFYRGAKILENPAAQRLIKKQRKLLYGKDGNSAVTALRRIIFNDPKEAVDAVLDEADGISYKNRDYFSVSEIKRVKGGGAELKLLNKLDALKLLYDIEENEKSRKGSSNFFQALTKCGRDEEDNGD